MCVQCILIDSQHFILLVRQRPHTYRGTVAVFSAEEFHLTEPVVQLPDGCCQKLGDGHNAVAAAVIGMQGRDASITLQKKGQALIRRRTKPVIQHLCGAVGRHTGECGAEQLRGVMQGTDGGVAQYPCVGLVGHNEVGTRAGVSGFHRRIQRYLAGQHGVVSDFLHHNGDLNGLQRNYVDALGRNTGQPAAVLLHLLNFLQKLALHARDKAVVVLLSVDSSFHDFFSFLEPPSVSKRSGNLCSHEI